MKKIIENKNFRVVLVILASLWLFTLTPFYDFGKPWVVAIAGHYKRAVTRDLNSLRKSIFPKQGDFVKVGKMTVPREDLKAILLEDGRVLIHGGIKMGATNMNPEIYDPEKRVFKSIDGPSKATGAFSMTLLENNEVLFVGYNKETNLFNPTTNLFRLSGNLNYPRDYHTATLLNDGRVLIIGGKLIDHSMDIYHQKHELAEYSEIYNPKTEKFEIAAKMHIPRYKHSSILLQDGRVLILGGENKKDRFSDMEIYNPKTNKFDRVDNMKRRGWFPKVFRLKNGNIILIKYVENMSQQPNALATRYIEEYNPKTNELKTIARQRNQPQGSTVVQLKNDELLFVGGCTGVGLSLICTKASNIFDPETKEYIKGEDMNYPREVYRATLLKDGNVLITGSRGTVKTSELYLYNK